MALATDSGDWKLWVELEVEVEEEKVAPMVVREYVGWGSERKKRERAMERKIDRSAMAEDGRRENLIAGG